MPQLSIVIITFNEEHNIARCINSVKEIADEIVVLDSFSTDKTVEIATALGAKVFTHTFDGHIQQKNRAITYAKYPHILSLDADEALDEKLKISIALIKNNWQFEGYYLNRKTYYCGQWINHCGWYPDKKLRLWDSRKGLWGGINPHDKYELLDKNAETGYLKGDILHYSYYKIEEHKKQAEKFAIISANAFYQRGKKSNLFLKFTAPVWKFIHTYIIKLGFLDGYFGLRICLISAKAVFTKHNLLVQLGRQR
jgi:glycosyltransferase involved in cell wall biosynthesis